MAEDREIFKGIIDDVFPLEEVLLHEDDALQALVQDNISCLIPDRYKGRFRESTDHENFITKAVSSNELLVKKTMQMNKLKNHRGSFIVIGDAGSGKTTALSALAKALNQMAKESTTGVHAAVRIQKYFVKVFTVSELYGFADTAGVWQDGLLSRYIRSDAVDCLSHFHPTGQDHESVVCYCLCKTPQRIERSARARASMWHFTKSFDKQHGCWKNLQRRRS